MGNFLVFFYVTNFCRSDDFLVNFHEKSGVVGIHIVLLASLLMLVLLLVSLDNCISCILAVAGRPSAVDAVMFLLSL
jgi:hypothetical protein